MSIMLKTVNKSLHNTLLHHDLSTLPLSSIVLFSSYSILKKWQVKLHPLNTRNRCVHHV